MAAIFSTKKVDIIPLCRDNPAYQDVDTVSIDGLKYRRASKIAKTGRQHRVKPSVAWQHGELLTRERDQQQVYYCYLCESQRRPQQLPLNNEGSKPALNHILRVHKINSNGEVIQPTPPTAQPTMNPSLFFNVVSTYDFDEFKRLLIRWIVYCQVAFAMLENEYFRELVTFLNKTVGGLLPRARATLRRWIMAEFSKQKALLKGELQVALSSIHLSFDLWSSPNAYAIVSIYSHFIDKRGRRRTELLAFRRLFGDHGGVNQAATLLEVIREYEIESRIGYFVCDNAKSNDTAVDGVLKELYPYLTADQRRGRRLRCFGHITNLCARAMLLGKGAGKAMEEVSRKLAKGAFDAVDSFWHGRGGVGRLHNLIKYIRWTPQRREEFANTTKGGRLKDFDELQLIQDNSTRWNSFYSAIGRALDIKERINKFCRDYKPLDKKDTTIKDNVLRPTHWHQLDRLHDCLKLFEVGTMDTQGTQKPLSDWYPTLLWMLEEIDAFKAEFTIENDDTFAYLAECCSHAWRKVEKYFKLADEMPIVYAAVILDPRLKDKWFVEKWQDRGPEERRWIVDVTAQVKELWRTDYKAVAVATAAASAGKDEEDNLHARLNNFKRIRLSGSAVVTDPLDDYLQTDCVPWETTPSQYWIDRQKTTPELAKFALDTLAIPLMSDAPERSFSAGRDLITYRRSNLLDDIIEACTCLRSWYGNPKDSQKAFDAEDVIENDYSSQQS